MNLNYETLRSFLCIAQAGSFSKAASQLFLSQPNLSNAIAALEADLQFELFYRTNRGVRLTPAGEVFHAHAQKIVEDMETAVRAGREEAGLCRGRIRIGCNWADAKFIFASICEAFSARYPLSELSFIHCSMENNCTALIRDEVDVCLSYNGEKLEQNGFPFLPLFRDHLQCFLSDGHPLSECSALHPEDLRDELLILPPLGICRCADRLRNYFKQQKLHIRIRDDLNRDALPALLSGQRYIVLQPGWLRTNPLGTKTLPFLFEDHLEVGLSYQKDPAPALQNFLSLAREHYPL